MTLKLMENFSAHAKNERSYSFSLYSKQLGFTIIELMIVIVIIATLASVALPSFRNYTARAKITEAINALGPAKLSISEAYFNQGMPNNDYEVPTVETKYVNQITYTQQNSEHSYLTVDTQNLGAGLDDGLQFSLYARGSDSGIDWDCAMSSDENAALPAEILPSQCRDDAPVVESPDTYID